MKRFLPGLRKSRIVKILIISLTIRLVLLPWSFHSDLTNNDIWGIYAREFGLRGFYDWLNFGNYARPDYPPLAMVLFLIIRNVWKFVFDILWFLNVQIDVFPSELVSWFDVWGNRLLIKLPGVLADLGIGYLIYKIVKKEGKESRAVYIAKLYLFNPAVIYLSASWGQLDSVVSLFALVSIYLLLAKKYYLSLGNYFVSIFIKATFAPLAIVIFLQSVRQKIKLKEIIISVLLLALGLWIIGYFFTDKNYLEWTVKMYLYKILPGAVTLPYINLNAFNFWGLVLGMERIKDEVVYGGLPLSWWAYLISLGLIILVLKKFWQGANVYFTILILYMTIFMFFSRVHERYLFPVMVFFPIVLSKYSRLTNVFYIISGVFLINLYHFWWMPEISLLVHFFDWEITERTLSFINLISFIILFRSFLKDVKS